MTVLDAHWSLIEHARWFSGKSRGGRLAEHETLGWYTDDGAPVRVRSELMRIEYPDGCSEWYHLPISYRRSPGACALGPTPDGFAHDATADPEAMSAVFHALRAARAGQGYVCHSIGAAELEPNLPPLRFSGEQSNTSVFFGRQAMLKFFRKLEPGANLDIELHAALASSDAVARLYGWISAPRFDLAMLVESLPEPVDGFDLAASKVGDDFSIDAAALGVALAHVHQGLRTELGTGEGSGDELAAQFSARARSVAREAPQLASLVNSLDQAYAGLRGLRFETQRVHGDFHLGQTLLTPHGWRIVDFEGEPMKTMDERRAMDSPWRDVAGMLRSIDYAATSTVDTTQWRSAARAAFLDLYCGAMGTQPSELLPAYELDKAVYEVLYETRNRPYLVHVPLDHIITTLKEN